MPSGAQNAGFARVAAAGQVSAVSVVEAGCTNVPSSSAATDPVAVALAAALDGWRDHRDARRLRRVLHDLLRALDD